MTRYRPPIATNRIGYLIPVVLLLSSDLGCAKQRHMVVAATGTNIGVEVSENPATQAPQAKLGYQRTELALVPTNRSTEDKASDGSSGKGAKDTTDVLMELRYGGIFDTGASSGIYQRLAVGKTAVMQPGASLMFAKDASGIVTDDAQKALKAVRAIPATNLDTRSVLACLTNHRSDDAKSRSIDAALKEITKSNERPDGLTWDDFVDEPDPATVRSLQEKLKGSNITCP